MSTEHLLFVYGSLMQGFQYHHMLTGAAFVTSGWTRPRWTLLDLGRYPGAIPGTQAVAGEVYTIDSDGLRRLDRLEGVPEFYRRSTAVVGDGLEAVIYQLQPDAVPAPPIEIPSGSWRQWCAAREP